MSNHQNLIKHKNIKKKKNIELVFNTIKNCKHEIKDINNKIEIGGIVHCAFCRLINLQTRSFFKHEDLKRKEDHENSNNNRAIMRRNLLIDWSKCQSSLYCDYFPTATTDIFISVTMANLIVSLTNKEREFIDFDDIIKLLLRKNRLIEVGYFAAVYLQSRIRSFLARLRVKKKFLLRFEYVSATKRKTEYFVDTLRLHKWERYPRVVGNEVPASPRTITRRLAAVDRRRDARLEVYRYYIKKNHIKEFDLFEQEDNYIARLRQLVVFRDIVADAMNKFRISRSDDYKPVWVTMSAPGLSARELGLSLAICNYPAPEGENLNKRLYLLEELTLQSLVCDSPDQVLSLCLIACGSNGANLSDVVQSVVNISQDDRNIWTPTVVLTDVGDIYSDNNDNNNNKNIDKNSDSKNNNQNPINKEEDKQQMNENSQLLPEMLPLCFQLHRYDNSKTSHGLFRLFFYDEELLGITQYSPWVYYPEVAKNKDNILHSINTYVKLPTTKAFIRNYYSTANNSQRDKYNKTDHNNNNTSSYNAYFIPPDNSIFDISKEDLVRKPLDNKTINDDKALELSNKYSFIKKLSLLSQRIKRGQNTQAKNLKKGIINKLITTNESEESNYSDKNDFVGTEFYKLSKTPAIKKTNYGSVIPKLDISKYSRRLLKYGKETVNADIGSRINIPIENEPKEYKLLVIDIYVHLPLPNMKPRAQMHDKPNNSLTHSVSMSTLSSGDNTVNLSNNNNHLYNVDSHRIVGIFSCDQERPPPSVDMGLLDWSVFHQMHKDILLDKQQQQLPKPPPITPSDSDKSQDRNNKGGKSRGAPKTPKTTTSSSSKPSTSNSDSAPGSSSSSSIVTNIKDKVWSFPDSRTGVSMYNSRTSSGRNLQFNIIANYPSEEYILEELPQSLQKWLKREII